MPNATIIRSTIGTSERIGFDQLRGAVFPTVSTALGTIKLFSSPNLTPQTEKMPKDVAGCFQQPWIGTTETSFRLGVPRF
jgi:hypothetical protein